MEECTFPWTRSCFSIHGNKILKIFLFHLQYTIDTDIYTSVPHKDIWLYMTVILTFFVVSLSPGHRRKLNVRKTFKRCSGPETATRGVL